MTSPQDTILAPLPDGPYDIEFFFDPGCPFAWQTSVWIRRVQELRGIAVGWRFISLKFLNEDQDQAAPFKEAQDLGLRFHRVCAAARAEHGNDAVAALYKAWGEAYWYRSPEADDWLERIGEAAQSADPAAVIAAAGLPASLLAAADDESWDAVVRAETDAAIARTGKDVGTPIITYDPPTGNSLFGPVISEIPDDEQAVAFYDALRTFVDFPAFSELKRSNRAPLDLPLLAS